MEIMLAVNQVDMDVVFKKAYEVKRLKKTWVGSMVTRSRVDDL